MTTLWVINTSVPRPDEVPGSVSFDEFGVEHQISLSLFATVFDCDRRVFGSLIPEPRGLHSHRDRVEEASSRPLVYTVEETTCIVATVCI